MTSYDNDKPKPTITFDYDLYARYLEDADLTENQKREFLEALWSIICEFVALGFNVHPLQQAQEPCGKLTKTTGFLTASGEHLLDSNHPDLTNLFNVADAGKPEEAGKDELVPVVWTIRRLC